MARPQKKRCTWCTSSDIYIDYHDQEWGVPEYDDQALFAKLILDGAQAGLSWITILKKRDNYYRTFDGLDPHKMARYTDKKLEKILQDPGIVRNRLKVAAARKNAQGYLKIMKEHGSFSDFLWQFVGGKPIQNKWKSLEQVPTKTKESDAMSKELKRYGFSFVGSTICYAFMQAVGMVNDHTTDCFRHRAVKKL